MSCEDSIISVLNDSFNYNGYHYYKYGKYYKVKLDNNQSGPEEIDDDEYFDAKDLRNSNVEYDYKDLDDETINDVKRMKNTIAKVENDKELSYSVKSRYIELLNNFMKNGIEYNIPISDYIPKKGSKASKELGTIIQILNSYDKGNETYNSRPYQEYDPPRRKYTNK